MHKYIRFVAFVNPATGSRGSERGFLCVFRGGMND